MTEKAKNRRGEFAGLQQGEMQAESTPENGGKDEKAIKGAYNQREQVEQPGKRRETQEIHKRVD